MQDCSISSASALELLQSCTKPSKLHLSIGLVNLSTPAVTIPLQIGMSSMRSSVEPITYHTFFYSNHCRTYFTHSGRVTHIRQWMGVTIGSNDGLAPVSHQDIIWTGTDLFIKWTLRIKIHLYLNQITRFLILFKNIYLKVSSAERRTFWTSMYEMSVRVVVSDLQISNSDVNMMIGYL